MAVINVNKSAIDPSHQQRSDEIRQRERLARTSGALDPAPNPGARGDEVMLGQALEGLRFQDMLTERLQTSMAGETRLSQLLEGTEFARPAPLSQAPRVDRSAFGGAGLDPALAADQITEFVEKQLLPAFKSENPEATIEALNQFEADLMEGFKAGMEDARKILDGLGALSDGRREQLAEVDRLVSDKLPGFVRSAFSE
ncbi:MAG: DUF5610 domain-containing protein [Candidatus Sumerlaeota bacterium]